MSAVPECQYPVSDRCVKCDGFRLAAQHWRPDYPLPYRADAHPFQPEVCGHVESEHFEGVPNEDDTGRIFEGCGVCISEAAPEAHPWHPFTAGEAGQDA